MTWEVNNIVLMKIGQILQKEKFIKKLYKNCDIKTSSRPFCVCKELSTTSIGKWNWQLFVKRAKWVLKNLHMLNKSRCY